ncbi:hypothetical protein V3595_04545 [Bacillus sp. CFBP9009]
MEYSCTLFCIQTNKLVVFNLVMHPQIIGMISTVKDGIIEMMNAQWGGGFVNMMQVECFHFPQ